VGLDRSCHPCRRRPCRSLGLAGSLLSGCSSPPSACRSLVGARLGLVIGSLSHNARCSSDIPCAGFCIALAAAWDRARSVSGIGLPVIAGAGLTAVASSIGVALARTSTAASTCFSAVAASNTAAQASAEAAIASAQPTSVTVPAASPAASAAAKTANVGIAFAAAVAISAGVAVPTAASIPLIAGIAASAAFATTASVPATVARTSSPAATSAAVRIPVAPTVAASCVATAVSAPAAVALTTSMSIAAAIPVSVPPIVAIVAAIALGKRRPVDDGRAGSMAEIQLDAERKGRREACDRDEGMSPPACHASLACRQLSRESGSCGTIETSKQNPTWKVDCMMH
jgi:hypothetical protein